MVAKGLAEADTRAIEELAAGPPAAVRWLVALHADDVPFNLTDSRVACFVTW